MSILEGGAVETNRLGAYQSPGTILAVPLALMPQVQRGTRGLRANFTMNAETTTRKAQFELEKELARRILSSSKEHRAGVTAQAYDELFQKFPRHEGHGDLTDDRYVQKIQRKAARIIPLVRPGDRILEIGCGCGDVLAKLSALGCDCVGVEASLNMVKEGTSRSGVKIVSGTAKPLDFPDDWFDLVFSQQLVEHLHPDDVPEHFAEAFRVLRPGSIFAVETPNRRTGPQDISRGFTPIAQGLHIKEWYHGEVVRMLRRTGFVSLRGWLAPPFGTRRSVLCERLSRVPAYVKWAEDLLLAVIPGREIRTLVARLLGLNDIYLFSHKPRTETPAKSRSICLEAPKSN